MDADTALRIISGGETLTVEFKRRRSSQDLNDRKLVEAVACMANGQGGHIFIGVENDGTVSGT
ncbi:MAG: ATP-binding protein [Corynebacterium humireducens]|jgi:ATP-dependent DNA helicase RecG|uniref:ATP-binding protein n=1 Tax=Corynebacterium humireducens TaxID=1223514 RepID=A0A7X6PMW2_9CORY|nr:ATP-binding protein [Corynebacterium humireducens]